MLSKENRRFKMALPISDAELARAREVLRNFQVKHRSRQAGLESGLFAIANQASPWERPSKFVYALRKASYPDDPHALQRYASLAVLTDEERVNTIAKQSGWRFHHQDRFGPFLRYFGAREDAWWEEVIHANEEARMKYIREIDFISLKTFSFWQLCLGGTKLLPIDIHVRRHLSGLGVPIDEIYRVGTTRPHRKKQPVSSDSHSEFFPSDLFLPAPSSKQPTQTVVEEPTLSEYLRIERDARALFAQDIRFCPDGNVDMALVAAVLWWRGAHRQEAYQAQLFGGDMGGSWKLPYHTVRH